MAISMQILLDIYFYYFWCRAVMVWLRPSCSLNAAAFNDISVNKNCSGRTLSCFNIKKKNVFPSLVRLGQNSDLNPMQHL